MSYAQINYSQRVGTGPYSIAEVGCFLTAFSNLLARYGEAVDPPNLNNYFLQHGSYMHDPAEPAGTADNLAWGSVSAYDGQIATVAIGGAGWPDSNDAIVKFSYRSTRTGQMTTHFCLVQDHNAGTILDSWDGVVKKSPYGTPVAWAKYERHIPQIVTPPPAPEVPAFTVENIAEVTKELKVDAHLWDMNRRTWPDISNNPVGTAGVGTKFKTSQIAHHILGGSYYLPSGSTTQGYNVVDTEDPVPEPAPAPAAAAPVAPTTYSKNTVDGITFEALENTPICYYVTKVGGAEKWSFKGVDTWRGFTSVQHVDYGSEVWIVGVAHHPIPPKGADYYMTDADFGDFKKTGKPVNFYGFNWSDISTTKPPALPAAKPVSDIVSAPVKAPAPAPVAPPTTVSTGPVASSAPVDWQNTFTKFLQPVDYVATRNVPVKDLSGSQPETTLPEGTTVRAYGTVRKDNIDYYRLRTNNDPTFSFWYSVPKFDPTTRTPNLLVKPTTPLEPVSKSTAARDTLQLAKEKIELGAETFLDDIMPKWLKNKK